MYVFHVCIHHTKYNYATYYYAVACRKQYAYFRLVCIWASDRHVCFGHRSWNNV